MANNKEIWKPVVGYEKSYEVSNIGNVRSVDRTRIIIRSGKQIIQTRKGRIIKQYKEKGDYRSVCLSNRDKKKTFLVHQLVASAFLGERPKGFQICHNNGISSDNHLNNLRYDTCSENTKDQSRHSRRRLSPEMVRAIRYHYHNDGYKISYLSSFFNYDAGAISRIVRYFDGFYNHIPQNGDRIFIPKEFNGEVYE